jgi:glycine betaine/proline transport system substrate-binding protein
MKRPIRVGHIALSFHDASARPVEEVLKKHGHTIERSAAPHEEMFHRLGRAEVDVLVSAWLPASHSKYLGPIEDQVRKVSVLYEPYCIWGVPEFVPKEDVGSVADLLRPPALKRMERLIQGINSGAGISRFSQAIVTEYGLGAAGYEFRTGGEADCFDRFEAAVQEKQWVIVPLWHPQYLHNRYRVRALDEPKGLLGGVDQATLIVRRDAEPLIGSDALAELAELHLGNARVSALDDALRNS